MSTSVAPSTDAASSVAVSREPARRRPALASWAMALGALIALPACVLGFYADDFIQIGMLNPDGRLPARAWDLYRFVGGDAVTRAAQLRAGVPPWWSSSSLSLHLLRPIPSLFIALDHALFGDHALGYHVDQILFWLAALVALRALYEATLTPKIAAFALLLFAIDDAHFQPICWSASRHVLLAAVPALLAIAAHVRAREGGTKRGRGVALAFFALALACSEAGLSTLVYIAAYEITAKGPRRDRALAVAPAFALALAYLVLYRALGFGMIGAATYVDPLHDPIDFAKRAATGVLVLFGDAFFGAPSDASNVGHLAAWLAAVGAVATLAVAALARAVAAKMPEEERRRIAFFTLGAAGSTVVGVGAVLGARLLFFPSIGFAPLLATLIARGFEAGPRAWLRKPIAAVLAFANIVAAPLSFAASLFIVPKIEAEIERAASSIPLAPPLPKDVLLLASSDPGVVFYAPIIHGFHDPYGVSSFQTLSMARADHVLTRTGRRSFRLEAAGASFVAGAFPRLFRGDEPMNVGDKARTCVGVVEVARVDHGAPTAIDVTLDRDPEDVSLEIVEWTGAAFERVRLPDIGASMRVPFALGPTRYF